MSTAVQFIIHITWGLLYENIPQGKTPPVPHQGEIRGAGVSNRVYTDSQTHTPLSTPCYTWGDEIDAVRDCYKVSYGADCVIVLSAFCQLC